MEEAYEYLRANFEITEADWEIIASKMVEKRFKKKDILLAPGEQENLLSFLSKGMLRFFIPTEEDKDNDITYDFMFEKKFFSADESFLTRTPSLYGIEALSDIILYQFTYDDLQDIYKKTGTADRIGRIAHERLFLERSHRLYTFLRFSAKERYENLLKENPTLIQEIPQKYIASYLGITPQALSRIRRQIY
ncbi:CarD family transcriptional regulator [Chryseobacterium angstadtii]|uniref:CarD family transcriptional regulator n=1 Tax=Chryseobacterium angstadtii TaxID=558151 RepID=A0A0J7IKD3_9FLAO|nr:Crp/Fnr family transcriptional regulator [Chryseobacterium angstadtii]KMQ66501.1 CarD family transcriptional regulator [Chryseobacterium angstadtii]